MYSLAVGVGPGPALAEQDVRLSVGHAGAVEASDVFAPLCQLGAAVDEVDPYAVGGQD